MNGKGALAIVVGFGAGAWFGGSAVRKMLVFQRARHWPAVRGKIIESLVLRDPGRRNATHFRVSHEFVIGDRIRGDTPRLSGEWFWNNRPQAEFVARFAPGQEVDVFHDPRDPRRNCLDRDDRGGSHAEWVLALGGTVLAGLLVWLEAAR